MLFSQLTIVAFVASAFAAPFGPDRHGDWDRFHGREDCERGHFVWDARGFCGPAAEAGFPAGWRHGEWDGLALEECTRRRFHWDGARCGPILKRDVSERPRDWRHGEWDRFERREDCERGRFVWDARGFCGPRAGLIEYPVGWRHGEWDGIYSLEECSRRRFRWDGVRCGPILKREESERPREWRHGEWDRFNSLEACRGAHFYWHPEFNACYEEPLLPAVGGLVGGLVGGVANAVDYTLFHTEAECVSRHGRWRENRCGPILKRDIAERPRDWRHGEWDRFERREDCERSRFVWDARGWCGPRGFIKRDVSERPREWRHGEWDRFNSFESCRGARFYWHAEFNACYAEPVLPAVGGLVGGLLGGVTNAIDYTLFNTESECISRHGRWRENRCGPIL
jgi:hypothetical protein